MWDSQLSDFAKTIYSVLLHKHNLLLISALICMQINKIPSCIKEIIPLRFFYNSSLTSASNHHLLFLNIDFFNTFITKYTSKMIFGYFRLNSFCVNFTPKKPEIGQPRHSRYLIGWNLEGNLNLQYICDFLQMKSQFYDRKSRSILKAIFLTFFAWNINEVVIDKHDLLTNLGRISHNILYLHIYYT